MSRHGSLLARVDEAIAAIHKAFGAPGNYGYEHPQGKALYSLYRAHLAVSQALRERPVLVTALEDRLAECLAVCVDTTLLTVRDTLNDCPVELRLGSFNREISERAAALLEEAGR